MLLRRDVDQELNEHIDMTPMVDVVFQLMTFMLFSVQMTGGEKVDVPACAARGGRGRNGGDFLDPDQTRGNRGSTTASCGHGDRARGDAGAGPPGCGRWRQAGRRKVILQADGDVPHGEVVKVAGAVAQVEGITVHVGVQEPQGH